MKKPFTLLSLAAAAAILTTACSNSQPVTENHGASHSEQNMSGMNHGGHQEGQADAEIKTTWSYASGTPQSKKTEKITISVQKNDGAPIEEFEIIHEKKLHLIVVSKDLSFFNHIHPEYQGKGVFTIDTQFPAGGDYKLIADYIPKGGTGVTAGTWAKVAGGAADQQAIAPDQKMTKVVDGKEVALSFDGDLRAGKELMMTFNIKDAATKQPITTLQPYLGAIGHVVILSADAEQYLHVHPGDENAKGPDAIFHTQFPAPGIYKIWGQFQHQGSVFTVPFVVNVQ